MPQSTPTNSATSKLAELSRPELILHLVATELSLAAAQEQIAELQRRTPLKIMKLSVQAEVTKPVAEKVIRHMKENGFVPVYEEGGGGLTMNVAFREPNSENISPDYSVTLSKKGRPNYISFRPSCCET